MTKAPSGKDSLFDGTPPSLTIDWAIYAAYLDESDLDDDQKREFIETLWSIVVSFVDLGFGVDPIQQACGQNGNGGIFLPADMISSKHNSDNQLSNKAADQSMFDSAGLEES